MQRVVKKVETMVVKKTGPMVSETVYELVIQMALLRIDKMAQMMTVKKMVYKLVMIQRMVRPMV